MTADPFELATSRALDQIEAAMADVERARRDLGDTWRYPVVPQQIVGVATDETWSPDNRTWYETTPERGAEVGPDLTAFLAGVIATLAAVIIGVAVAMLTGGAS